MTRERTRTKDAVDRLPRLSELAKNVSAKSGSNVMRRSTVLQKTTVVPTSAFVLDMGLLGGLPEGSVTTLVGWESAGKTTMAMRIAASVLRKYEGRKGALFIDAEGKFDQVWAARHGAAHDDLYLAQPDGGEHAVDIYYAALQNSDVGCIILDSIPSLVPFKVTESSASDSMVAERSRLIGRLVDFTHTALPQRRRDNDPVTVVLINQWRSVIGSFRGPTRVMPGGHAPRYMSSVIVEIKNKEQDGKDERSEDVVLHNKHSFQISKTKLGNANKTGEFNMVRHASYGMPVGTIDEFNTIVSYAKKFGLLGGSAGRYTCWGRDSAEFRRYDDIAAALYQDETWASLLRREIMMMHRVSAGLDALPPDGYLCGVHPDG